MLESTRGYLQEIDKTLVQLRALGTGVAAHAQWHKLSHPKWHKILNHCAPMGREGRPRLLPTCCVYKVLQRKSFGRAYTLFVSIIMHPEPQVCAIGQAR